MSICQRINRVYKQSEEMSTKKEVKIVSKDQSFQMCAVMILDLGKWIGVNQLCISTAIVFMRKFYDVNSDLKGIHKSVMAASALFLAGKTEEQPRKVENIVCAAERMYGPSFIRNSDDRKRFALDIVLHEELIIMSIGFGIQISHPHPIIIKTTGLIKATRELSRTAYVTATQTLILTRFCLIYPPEIVACVCIHMACLRRHIKIPESIEGKSWWKYIDPSIEFSKIEAVCKEFLDAYRSAPQLIRDKFTELDFDKHGSDDSPTNSKFASNSKYATN
ncbi:hypothetical protein GJ496_012064 [Pomphorhynchus laevis]|nr:hypothetical protein GJ496_012064 [Pomphorhynchus laevis]